MNIFSANSLSRRGQREERFRNEGSVTQDHGLWDTTTAAGRTGRSKKVIKGLEIPVYQSMPGILAVELTTFYQHSYVSKEEKCVMDNPKNRYYFIMFVEHARHYSKLTDFAGPQRRVSAVI